MLSFKLKEAWKMAQVLGGNFQGRKEADSVAELAAFLLARIMVETNPQDVRSELDIPGSDAALISQAVAVACNPKKIKNQEKDGCQWSNISAEVREMMMAEFGIRYVGDGWLKIEEATQSSQ